MRIVALSAWIKRQIAMVIAIGGASVALSLGAGAAQAHDSSYNAARVEALTRPCFGMLLDHQLRSCGGKRYRSRGHYYGYHGTHATATINCDKAGRAFVEDTVRRMRSNGVLRLVAKNRSCIGSLHIARSLTIIGESSSSRLPVLVAPDGEACLRISPTADKVTLKNVLITSSRGGQLPCIQAANSEVTLQNSSVRYEGEAAAVQVSGGRFNLVNSFIVARTRSVALSLSAAQLFAERSGISSTADGLYATLIGDSQIQGVTVQQLADWRGFERGEDARGIEVRLDASDAILNLEDIKVEHFAQAIVLEGAGEALLANSLVDFSKHGIRSKLNRVRIIDNRILSDEIAINVDGGTGFIGKNQIAKVRTAGILASGRGEIRAVDNAIDPAVEGCPDLKWGELDPAQRVCTPWYRGSEFDIPASATRQFLFNDYWPHIST